MLPKTGLATPDSYGPLGIKISAEISACYQPLPMQQNLPKFAQNCQNLPKSTQRQNFEIPPKIEILVFFQKNILHIEEVLEHVFTIWIFNPRIFHMLFLLSKNGLCL
jgi:hypothetical protein